jgi:hypothetical protein
MWSIVMSNLWSEVLIYVDPVKRDYLSFPDSGIRKIVKNSIVSRFRDIG